VHNNYYFLRQLSKALERQVVGFTLVSCFSQNKDELILELNNSKQSLFIKASLLPDFQCLSFPVEFHRARKNSVDLFPEVVMQSVVGIRQFENERSFGLTFQNDLTLVFKMHGQQANVILFEGIHCKSAFRNNFPVDKGLKLNELDREIDWSFEVFENHQHDLESIYFTFGKAVWGYLRKKDFDNKDLRARWDLLTETRQLLQDPTYAIVLRGASLQLSLLPEAAALHTFKDPTQALNEFFLSHQSTAAFLKEKAALLSTVRGRIKQTKSFLDKSNQRLREVQSDTHNQLWADLIMANLHTIAPGAESVSLDDFHNPGNSITIKLKRELTPLRNAEAMYRKEKNRAIELRTLNETIYRKEDELIKLQQHEEKLLAARDRAALKPFTAAFAKQSKEKDLLQSQPYREFIRNDFRIWVGKNAKANDDLTLHYTFKEDLWLHARDVAGSHVVIKHQAGKPFPKDVIEYAASLAAFYSKRKNESLCPVAMTQAKHVRKRKGAPAGEVSVEREEVLIVKPWENLKQEK
jgi:predicted ribosome quality control (RQC) complex YloA/Tae2 family protein